MIDWARVNELQGEIGADDFDEVAVLFLEEADEAVASLCASMAAKPLESALHFLKGSALNLGFSDLAGLCQTGEKAAAGGSVDVDIDAIKTVYDLSKSAFRAGQNAALSA